MTLPDNEAQFKEFIKVIRRYAPPMLRADVKAGLLCTWTYFCGGSMSKVLAHCSTGCSGRAGRDWHCHFKEVKHAVVS